MPIFGSTEVVQDGNHIIASTVVNFSIAGKLSLLVRIVKSLGKETANFIPSSLNKSQVFLESCQNVSNNSPTLDNLKIRF